MGYALLCIVKGVKKCRMATMDVENESQSVNYLHQQQKNGQDDKSFNDFYNFCSYILAYEEQLVSSNNSFKMDDDDAMISQDETDSTDNVLEKVKDQIRNQSEEDEQLSSEEMTASDNNNDDSSHSSSDSEYGSDSESWNLVTCYCGRPYAGRPMIECSNCLTWVHLYCARVKKTNIPEVFYCQACKKKTRKKST